MPLDDELLVALSAKPLVSLELWSFHGDRWMTSEGVVELARASLRDLRKWLGQRRWWVVGLKPPGTNRGSAHRNLPGTSVKVPGTSVPHRLRLPPDFLEPLDSYSKQVRYRSTIPYKSGTDLMKYWGWSYQTHTSRR